MKKVKNLFLFVTLVVITGATYAQAPYWVTTDEGEQMLVTPGNSEPALAAYGESLTTLFAANNSCHGNMFDLEVIASKPVAIQAFDINIETGTTNVSVYYKTGSYVGFENNSAAWTLVGTDNDVVGQGQNNPTSIDVGTIVLDPGTLYAFYITVDPNISVIMNYTNGSATYSDASLELTAGVGICGLFGGVNDPRIWNGTIYYTGGNAVPFPYWAIAAVFVLIGGFILIRYNRRKRMVA
ncbi:MAG: hypothetical protein JW798_09115 [Prolixibacteraceae bacterium]|nr:hypothetical protein [Prolixibacteraceae bacterium]